MELAQPPSMIEKQVKTSKAKSEKKVKEEAGSGAKETSPVPAQPAQSIEGKFLIWFGPSALRIKCDRLCVIRHF